jgi:hypothetical protein
MRFLQIGRGDALEFIFTARHLLCKGQTARRSMGIPDMPTLDLRQLAHPERWLTCTLGAGGFDV